MDSEGETAVTRHAGGTIGQAEAWAAVRARNGRYDGRFVYAVSSTGIYCRPSCPSRRPLRSNVSFLPDAVSAEEAGYRACRRCRPKSSLPPEAAQRVGLAREYLEAHYDERVTLERLGREVRLSPFHLQRTFKKLVGMTPKDYAQAIRLRRLKKRLKKGDTVTTATYASGFGSSSRLYERANAHLGMTPAAYRRGGKGMTIRFTVVGSPLGHLLVAATERGVCCVRFGEADAILEEALRREYPAATVERRAGELETWVAAISRSLTRSADLLTLPLEVRATAFQLRVWQELRRIPPGETRTYAQIAAAIGRPAAARAVARACASNPVALAVPCHRVVRKDGGLGGYRWGVDRKRELLVREGALPASGEAGGRASSSARRPRPGPGDAEIARTTRRR